MKAAVEFRTHPINACGHQFMGDWSSFLTIERWLPYGAFYVPKGYEHSLRRPAEFDRGNGHILDEALAYMVVHLDSEHDNSERLGRGQWVVSIDGQTDLEVLDDADVKKRFEVRA
jgi:hypothetical protein